MNAVYLDRVQEFPLALIFFSSLEFQCNCIKNKYSDKTKTDTDTLMYKIKTENVYEDLCKDKELFDFSDYKKNSKYDDGANYCCCWWTKIWRLQKCFDHYVIYVAWFELN